MNDKREVEGILILIFVTIIWGSTFSVSKISLNYISPIILLFLRFTIGTISLFFYIKFFLREKVKISKYGLILGIINFLAIAFQTYGLKFTSATKTAFITGISVILVPIGEKFLFKNNISKNIWISVILAFLGLILLTLDYKEFKGINLGDFLVFLCAITYAFQILYISYVIQKGDISNIAFEELLLTSILSFIFAFTEYKNFSLTNIFIVFLPILYLGIVATSLTLTLQLIGQKYLPPSKSAIVYNLEPVFASLFAMIFLKENLRVGQWIGAILILLALFLSLPQFSNLNRMKKE